ncbi:MAG: hypoxanthine phosphoribosyltransferase [bacterium]
MRRVLTERQIQKRVKELAGEISRDYAGKELILVGVMRGATMFLMDLCRNITIPVAYDFIAVSSYGAATKSSGVVRIIKDLDESVESKHVLIVEDIIDSGLTLHYIVNNLRSRNVASLRVCTLLDRPYRREAQVEIQYNGFTINDDFVVGYGLDFNQKYRNLKDIYALE